MIPVKENELLLHTTPNRQARVGLNLMLTEMQRKSIWKQHMMSFNLKTKETVPSFEHMLPYAH